MGTSAFDKLWGDDPKAVQKPSGFDALWGADPNAALHAEFKRGDLKKRIENENAQDVAPSAWRAIPEAFQTVAAGVPGAKLLMSGARAKIEGRPLADVQREVNAETSDVPFASAIGKGVGAAALAPVLPASGLAAGALLGGADQYLNNDPGQTLKSRLVRGGVGASVGALLGKATETGINAVRGKMVGDIGKRAIQEQQDIADLDGPLYAKAKGEIVTAPTHPTLTAAFQEPDIAPYVEAVRNSRTMRGKTDGEIAMEVYKQMGKQQAQLATREAAGNLTVADQLAQKNIGAAKAQLMYAMKQMAPSFPEAVATHAAGASAQDAGNAGADMARRLIQGNSLAGAKQVVKSPAAFRGQIAQMTPQEARGASEGMLARINEMGSGQSFSPFRPIQSMRAFGRSNTLNGLIRAADERAGNTLPSAVQPGLLGVLAALANGGER